MATIPRLDDGDWIEESTTHAIADRLNEGTALLDTGTSQSIPDGIGSLTDLTLSAAQVTSDPSSAFVDASDAIKILEAGTYLVTWYVGWASDSAGARRAALKINGTVTFHDNRAANNANPTGNHGAHLVTLALNDLLTMAAAQSSGGALNVTTKHLAVKRQW